MKTSELLDLIDGAHMKMTAAQGIVDCVRVLSAGRGVVAGNEVVEASMPIALYQALELLQSVQAANASIADALLDRLRSDPASQ